MRIAVSSQNYRTITGHAGKTRRFLIYDVQPQQEPRELERLDLPKEMSLHEYHGNDHPLFNAGIDAVLTASAGENFVNRLGRRGIQVMTTSESDIAAALSALSAGTPLPAAAPHDHDHGHDHDGSDGQGQGHGHSHGHGHGRGRARGTTEVSPPESGTE